MNKAVSVKVDYLEFDELQLTLVHSMASGIKRELEAANVDPELTQELTMNLLFSVTTILDGSQAMPDSANGACPFLTFSLNEEATELLATEHCTSMHAYAVGCAEDAFESDDSE